MSAEQPRQRRHAKRPRKAPRPGDDAGRGRGAYVPASPLTVGHSIASRCAGPRGVSRIRARGLPRTLLIMSRAAAEGIEVEGLVREFKNGPRAVDGIELQ